MKRVVVTGLGLISSIGNNQQEVLHSLKNSCSGLSYSQEYCDLGLKSQVYGNPSIDIKDLKNLNGLIDRKIARFMGQAAAYACLAMQEAIADAKLSAADYSNENTGLIVGSGGASNADVIEAADLLRSKGIKAVGPFRVPRAMSSTTSACLATHFKIKGMTFSMSSACATSTHCVGTAYNLIQAGKQKMIFAGGGEELHWGLTILFDAMGALSTKFNHQPAAASRPFDVNRDGFVIAGGAGILILEELEHALAREANIYAELVGYGASSDGDNMVQPSGDGAARCMRQALTTVKQPIDYVNAHGTGTLVGDVQELKAMTEIFKDYQPAISSTKSLTGHSLGAAGVQELIYSMLMMKHNFITASANVKQLLPEGKQHNIVTKNINKNLAINTIMSNSFGFGGVNASIVAQRFNEYK